MAAKPTYEELEKRIRELEKEVLERKRAEAALRESEDRFRSLFENSIDAALLTAPDGSVLRANQAACDMFGYSEEEFRAVGRDEVVDLSDPRSGPALERRARTGKFRGELTCLRKDGSKFWGEVSSSVFTDDEGQHRSSMVIRDITEQKLADVKIRNSEERFRAAFMASPNSIAICKQKDGVWIDINQAGLDIFGYTREEAIGRSALDQDLWVDPNDRQKIVAELGRSGQVRNHEVRLCRKDGSVIIASVSARALRLYGVKHFLIHYGGHH